MFKKFDIDTPVEPTIYFDLREDDGDIDLVIVDPIDGDTKRIGFIDEDGFNISYDLDGLEGVPVVNNAIAIPQLQQAEETIKRLRNDNQELAEEVGQLRAKLAEAEGVVGVQVPCELGRRDIYLKLRPHDRGATVCVCDRHGHDLTAGAVLIITAEGVTRVHGLSARHGLPLGPLNRIRVDEH